MADENPSLGSTVVDPSGGANQARVRVYNERLVLSLVRWHGNLSKAEIARRSGLSAQTVTVIMRQLEGDGLLLKGAPVRGKVGQPSTPMMLNPEGAYAVGLKIDRRSCELYLVDFKGQVRMNEPLAYEYPTPGAILDFVRDTLPKLVSAIPPRRRSRLAGLGVAIPFELWKWEHQLGVAPGSMTAWKEIDFAGELKAATDLEIYSQNDCTAACGAELLFGRGSAHTSFAYFHIGYFIGGGCVLDNALYPGIAGNSGAFGTIRVTGPEGRPVPLLDCASLHLLEEAATDAGWDAQDLWLGQRGWEELGPILDAWIARAAHHLAEACLSVCSVIDFQAVMLDGPLPPAVRSRLVAATKQALSQMDLSGISPFLLEEGTLGADAQGRGAASLPLMGRFLIDSGVLFRS